jgi:hypothetical protein
MVKNRRKAVHATLGFSEECHRPAQQVGKARYFGSARGQEKSSARLGFGSSG